MDLTNKKIAIITAGEKIQPVLQPLTLPLSLEEKQHTPREGYDGFSYVEQQGLNGYVKVMSEDGKVHSIVSMNINSNYELEIIIE